MVVERISSGGTWEDEFGYCRVVVTGGYGGFTGRTAGSTAMINGVVRHPKDAYGQAVVAFQSALFALERAGFTRADTVTTRMYVIDIKRNAKAVGRAHFEILGEIRPAATMVGVAGLLDDRLLVEVEVVAWRRDDTIVA